MFRLNICSLRKHSTLTIGYEGHAVEPFENALRVHIPEQSEDRNEFPRDVTDLGEVVPADLPIRGDGQPHVLLELQQPRQDLILECLEFFRSALPRVEGDALLEEFLRAQEGPDMVCMCAARSLGFDSHRQ